MQLKRCFYNQMEKWNKTKTVHDRHLIFLGPLSKATADIYSHSAPIQPPPKGGSEVLFLNLHPDPYQGLHEVAFGDLAVSQLLLLLFEADRVSLGNIRTISRMLYQPNASESHSLHHGGGKIAESKQGPWKNFENFSKIRKKHICTVFENSPLITAKNYIPSSNICVKKSCSHCT